MILSSVAMIGARCGRPSPVETRAVGEDYVHSVYPFLGVDWGGNTFVGSAVPFGMVKLGPDMESFDGRPSSFGYESGGRILADVVIADAYVKGLTGIDYPTAFEAMLKDATAPPVRPAERRARRPSRLQHQRLHLPGLRALRLAHRRIRLRRFRHRRSRLRPPLPGRGQALCCPRAQLGASLGQRSHPGRLPRLPAPAQSRRRLGDTELAPARNLARLLL